VEDAANEEEEDFGGLMVRFVIIVAHTRDISGLRYI
jgi:hypothetical protein